MPGNEWVYVAIAGLLGAHLVTLLYAYRSEDSGTTLDSGSTEVPEQVEEGVCRCPECGAKNDSAYRFCKECVTELPATQLHLEHPSRQQQPY